MESEWESMTIDELFVLREQMQEVLAAKLLAKKATLELRLRQLNQQSKMVRSGLPTLLMTFGSVRHCLEASADCIAALSF